MSPSRRHRPGTYRPPRDRRDVLVAIACAISVLVVTAALLLVLRPRDESSDAPPRPVPTDVSAPADSAPLPPEATPPTSAPAAPPPGP